MFWACYMRFSRSITCWSFNLTVKHTPHALSWVFARVVLCDGLQSRNQHSFDHNGGTGRKRGGAAFPCSSVRRAEVGSLPPSSIHQQCSYLFLMLFKLFTNKSHLLPAFFPLPCSVSQHSWIKVEEASNRSVLYFLVGLFEALITAANWYHGRVPIFMHLFKCFSQ